MDKSLLRVLLVEDDEDDFLLTRDLLGEIKMFECEIEWAANFAAAKKAFAEKTFDICLIDYRLGERTGLELLREAVADGFRAPMILLTGEENRAVDLDAMKAGAADYLIKGKMEAALLERAIRYALEQRRAAEILEEAARRERAMIENALDVICTVDREDRFVTINQACFKMWGYQPQEIIGRQYIDLVAPEDVPKTIEIAARIMSGEEITGFENCYLHKNGSLVHLTWTAYWSPNEQLMFAVAHDITERKRIEANLQESEYKLRSLLKSMREGLLQVDTDDLILFANDCFCEMTDYSSDELMGTDWVRLVFDEDGRTLVKRVKKRRFEGVSDNYELCLRKKSGEPLWIIVGGAPTLDAEGVVTGSIGVFTDITERKRAEERLLHDAFHDGLTGLANRTFFTDHLQMTIDRTKRDPNEMFAVLFLDFDRFKVINDSLGHTEGDKLLRQIAQRLESSLRSGDLVARLGGDEFTILVNKIKDSSVALRVAERLQERLQAPFEIGGGEVFISASIGIALSLTGHEKAENMLRDADIAMYRAKAKGRAQHQVFDQTMHEHALKQLRLETEMRQAIERGEFTLHYQPIVNLETETLVGFEALIRWNHPSLGIIAPFEFISAAEENGLILPLGDWILRESCQQLREWQNSIPAASSLTVSVNLSSKQFVQPDLAERIAATLAKTKLKPRFLKLEITESHIMGNTETAIKTLNGLRSLGVELSLDDFGTGYSSLSYLHRLPVSYLKSDRSFVAQMIESEENAEIVSTIIKLARNLKMKVVAEGIENTEQLAHLKNLECEYGQGYFFSKPLEAKTAEMFIGENLKNFMSR
ncbi:MAG: EAL domain-containing protein [Pyrinomonadaceae bacterium]